MKKKNIIAISFIYIASIFLLAHAIMPHFHHDDIMCTEQLHSQHCETTTQDKHECNHTKENGCFLQQVVVKQNVSDQSEVMSTYPTILFLTLHPESLNKDVFATHTSIYWSDIFYFYTSFISPTLGLRAPPIG